MADIRYSADARPRVNHLRLIITAELSSEPGPADLTDDRAASPWDPGALVKTAQTAHRHIERVKGALADGDLEAARAFAVQAGVETSFLCCLAEDAARG
jgi:hypothetical protein